MQSDRAKQWHRQGTPRSTSGQLFAICGGQSGTGIDCCPSPSLLPQRYHSIAAACALMLHTGSVSDRSSTVLPHRNNRKRKVASVLERNRF
jgi:hypothetical protein